MDEWEAAEQREQRAAVGLGLDDLDPDNFWVSKSMENFGAHHAA